MGTDINDYVKDTGFGTGANRIKFEADGSLVMEGDATQWDDVVGPILGSNLSANAGTADYDWDENCVAFSASGDIADDGDRISMNVQIPHRTKTGSTACLHCHYEQTEADTTPRTFTGRYRLQSNGAAKTTSWTDFVISTADGNALSYTSGTLNQICELADVDLTGAGISSTLQIQLTRSDAESGVVNMTFCDIHVEMDTLGSRSEYTK